MLAEVYSSDAISNRVKGIADEINRDFKGEDMVHIIITLTGAFMFAADLIRQLNVPLCIHFAGGQSYSGVEVKDMRIDGDAIPPSFGNKPVIIIEDIVDSGVTVSALRQILADRSASTIKVATLLKRQSCKGDADYYGFTIPTEMFVVGYGMDMDGRYRELATIQTIGNATNLSGMC